MPDLNRHIGDLARRLLGEPNTRLSTRNKLRFGTNGSVAVEIAGAKRGEWYDHEAGEGGGPWDLVRIKAGKVDGEAVEWLESELGIKIETQTSGEAFNIAVTYDYCDERGELLFQVVRLAPKDFRQRRPNGKGGWI